VFAIESALLEVMMVSIRESNKFERTYRGPPDIAFSKLGPAETCCCVKKPVVSISAGRRPKRLQTNGFQKIEKFKIVPKIVQNLLKLPRVS
jgi:hypothetical protein